MKRTTVVFWLLAFCLVACLSAAAAEGSNSNAQGYVFVAPAAFTVAGHTASFLQFGAGGEAFVAKNLAFAAEVGAAAPTRGFGDLVGVFSTNAAYHFRNNDHKVVPFVTGGYSMLFRSGTKSGANLGVGFTWWIKEHHGLRVEVRDNVFPDSTTGNLVGVRLGWSFR
jgi:hypothetical protein